MKFIKKFIMAVLLLGMLFFVTACKHDQIVKQNEVGIEIADGEILQIFPPGRHDKSNRRATLQIYNGNTQYTEWTNKYIWTKEGQEIEMYLSIDYARSVETDDVNKMLRYYPSEAIDDDVLEARVKRIVPEVVKNISTKYPLMEMVGLGSNPEKTRETLKNDIINDLRPALKACGIDLIDLNINNVEPSEAYKKEMQKKSQLALEMEIAAQQRLADKAIAETQQAKDAMDFETIRKKNELETQILLTQKQNELELLEAEQELEEAKTAIALEEAKRQNLIAQEEAKIYEMSPEAFELAKLDKWINILKPTDKVYFGTEGMDISLFLDKSPITE